MKQFFTWRSAILDSDLSFTTKGVLLILSTYMNDHGEGAYPSQKTIAKKGSLSPRAVRDHLKLAVKAGWLVKRKHGYGDQRNNQNEYHIAFPKRPSDETPDEGPNEQAGEQAAPASENEKQGNVVPKQGNVVPKAGEYDDQKQGKEVPPNTPVNSPVNSPITSSEENEIKNQSKNSKKGKSKDDTKFTIQELIDPARPISDRYLEIARTECEATDNQITAEYRTWLRWWRGQARSERTSGQWLECWASWICRNIGRESDPGGHKTGQANATDDPMLAAARRIRDKRCEVAQGS